VSASLSGRRARASERRVRLGVSVIVMAVGLSGSATAGPGRGADSATTVPGRPQLVVEPGPSPVERQRQAAAPDSNEPGSELRAWLLTMGPGEAIWERFGHNAIRVVDTRTGYDASYNWGIFDFRQEDFVPRFLQGRMLYMMAAFASEPMIESYRSAGREVVSQELDLTPSQKLELRRLAELNALPENREYFYDYFLDNCSTRVRDLLDVVLGGVLYDRFGEAPTGTSYRYHTRRLTRPDPALFTGMDILLGTPGDQHITRWAEMFIPMTLRDAVREVRVVREDGTGGGTARPLVISEEVLAPARAADEPEEPPLWWPLYLLIGVLIAGGLWRVGVHARERRGARIALALGVGAWSVLTGLAGLILVLVLFTDHHFMTWNENLFLLNPLGLVLAVAGPLAVARPSVRPFATGLSRVVVAVAAAGVLVGLAPFATQANGMEIALFLPAHVGAWLGMRALASPHPAGAAGRSAG